MKTSKNVTTLAIVGGVLFAVLFWITESNQPASPQGGGIGEGFANAGTGVGVGAAAVGVGGGAAFVIWALGNFIFPGL